MFGGGPRDCWRATGRRGGGRCFTWSVCWAVCHHAGSNTMLFIWRTRGTTRRVMTRAWTALLGVGVGEENGICCFILNLMYFLHFSSMKSIRHKRFCWDFWFNLFLLVCLQHGFQNTLWIKSDQGALRRLDLEPSACKFMQTSEIDSSSLTKDHSLAQRSEPHDSFSSEERPFINKLRDTLSKAEVPNFWPKQLK